MTEKFVEIIEKSFDIKAEHRTPEMIDNPEVVCLKAPHGDKSGRPIVGIHKIYQFRCTRDMAEKQVTIRSGTCWCFNCSNHDYVNCLTHSIWNIVDL